MGKMSRTKGKVGEREAAKELSRILDRDVTRSQQYKGAEHSADLANTGKLHFEVKRIERFNLYDALEQADHDRGENSIPVVLHRRNRKPWVCVIYLDDVNSFVEEMVNLHNE